MNIYTYIYISIYIYIYVCGKVDSNACLSGWKIWVPQHVDFFEMYFHVPGVFCIIICCFECVYQVRSMNMFETRFLHFLEISKFWNYIFVYVYMYIYIYILYMYIYIYIYTYIYLIFLQFTFYTALSR